MATKTRSLILTPILVFALAGLAACGGDAPPPADAAQDVAAAKEGGVEGDFVRTPARPGTMFKVDYRIVGTPVVGSPVSIDLEIDSTLGDEPVEIGYQIPDPSALAMDEAQPRTLTRAPLAGERRIRERVTVIPQREGRLFINVRTSRSDDDGSASTMISIPIHVGNVDTSLQEHGRLETDAEGETTRVLTSN
jgi:predicted small lipoprotein YifL